MQVTINPYYRSVSIDGIEVIQKILPFPDHLNHLATVSCTVDEVTNTDIEVTDVRGVHRYVSHFIQKEYYYKHLPSFIKWHGLEKAAQEAKEIQDHDTLVTIINDFITPEIDALAKQIANNDITDIYYNRNLKTINLIKGQLSTITTLLPEVTDTHSGLMTPADIAALREAQKRIFALENLLNNPGTGSGSIDISMIPRFSNTSFGLIKGTVSRDGGIYAETDGTGSVVGWDKLISRNDTIFLTAEQLKAAEDPVGSGMYPSLIGKTVVLATGTFNIDNSTGQGGWLTYWKLTENGDSNLSGVEVGEYYGRMDTYDFEKIYGPNPEPQTGDVCFSVTDKKISGVIQNPSPDDSNRIAVTITQKEMPELLAVDSISKDQAVILEMENTGKDANGNDNGSVVGSDKPRIGDRYWVRIGWGVPLNVARFWTGRYKSGPVLTFITEGGKYPQNNKYLCILVSVAPPDVWVQEPVHLTTHLEELPLYEYNVATGQRRQQFGRTGKLLYAKLISTTLTTKGAGDEYDWQAVQDDFRPSNGYFLMGTEASTSYTESTLQSGSRYRDSDISVFSDDDEGLSVYYFDQEPTIRHNLTCTARLYFHKNEQS